MKPLVLLAGVGAIGMFALGALGVLDAPGAAEWSHAGGVVCTYDHDFPNVPVLNCGAVVMTECRGARLNGTVAYGYRHEGDTSGFLLRCHVHEADSVMCEPCCILAGGCNPPDAGYSICVLNP